MEGEPPRCDRRCLGAATAAEAALWGLGQCGGLTRRREMKCFLRNTVQNVIYLLSHARTYERWSWLHPILYAPMKDGAGFDFEIYEVDHQDRLVVDGDVAFH
jgi:hypothetical protein